MSKASKSLFFFIIMLMIGLYGSMVGAAPASGLEFEYVQPSGETFKATVNGDEKLNWITAETGEVIVQDPSDKYWKFAEKVRGKIEPSKYNYSKLGQRPLEVIKDNDVIIQVKRRPRASRSSYLMSNSINTSSTNTKAIKPPFLLGDTTESTQPILALLVEFTNVNMQYSDSEWNNSFFGTTGSTVNNYYKEVSEGKFWFTPAQETHGTANDGIIKVKLNYAHPNTAGNIGYANQKIVSDALKAADPYINYASFDTNGNGRIETNELHVVTVVAGYEASYGGASPSVWGHRWGTYVTLDGTYLSAYTQQGEVHYNHMATIGILCHELGHDLGLPDLYDYDGSSYGVGIHSIMAGGSWASSGGYAGSSPTHFDAWSKIELGFATPTEVASGDFTVSSFDTGNYKVLKIPTKNPKEYFLVENRQNKGFDMGLASKVKNFGVAIWHIDENILLGWAPNNNENHKGVDLEEANEGTLGYSQLDRKYYSNYYHYYSSSNVPTFSSTSIPNSNLYDGTKTDITITANVPSSSNMIVNVLNTGLEIPPIISNTSVDAEPFAPDGSNVATVSYELSKDANTSITVYDSNNKVVKVIKDSVQENKGVNTATWDGKDSSGNIVSDGVYTFGINAQDYVGLNATPKYQDVTVEKDKPTISNVNDTPDPFTAAGSTVSTISYTLSENSNINVKIYDSNNELVKALFDGQAKSGDNTITWDGDDDTDSPAQNGIYTYKINAVDSFNKAAEEVKSTITIDRGAPVTLTLYGHKPDPYRFYTRITYGISQSSYVSLNIFDSNNNLVRNLINNSVRTAGTHYTTWTGMDNNKKFVPSGVYTYTLEAQDFGGNISGPLSGTITVDRTGPTISDLTVSDSPFIPNGANSTNISYNLSDDAKIYANIFDSNNRFTKTLVYRGMQSQGANSTTWDGKNKYDEFVEDGTYTVKVSGYDSLGNRSATSSKTIIVDRVAPIITDVSDSPDPLRVGDGLENTIEYTVSEDAHITIDILDSNGNVIKLLIDEDVTSGTNQALWDGTNNSGAFIDDGIYTYKIIAVDKSDKSSSETLGTITTDKTAITISNVSINPVNFTPSGAINYTISKDAKVTIKIFDNVNNEVKVIENDTQMSTGHNSSVWDGTDKYNKDVESGTYKFIITAVDTVGFNAAPAEGTVVLIAPDKEGPIITNISDSPDPFKLGTAGAINTIKYTLSEKADVSLRIYDSANKLVRTIKSSNINSGENSIEWDGKNDSGSFVADGIYIYRINATDEWGNVGSEVVGTITTDKTSISITNVTTTPDKFAISGNINYTLSESGNVTITIYDQHNNEVNVIVNAADLSAGQHTSIWNGRDSNNFDVQSGSYTYVITAIDKVGFMDTEQGTIVVDGPAPVISNLSSDPEPFIPSGSNSVTIKYTLSSNADLNLKIYDKDNKLVRTLKDEVPVLRGQNTATWNGKNDSGSIVADGVYTYKISAVDAVGKTSNVETASITIDKTAPQISNVSATPNPFGTDSKTTISYELSERAKVSIKILDDMDNVVKVLQNNVVKYAGNNSVEWNSTDSNGNTITGTFTFTITATDDANFTNSKNGSITSIDGSLPTIADVDSSPDLFTPDGVSTVNISYTLSKDVDVTLKIYDDEDNLVKTLIDNVEQVKGKNTVWWNGKDNSGAIVAEGKYTFKINAVDMLGNSANESTGTIAAGEILTITEHSISDDPYHADGSDNTTVLYSLTKPANVSVIIYNSQNQPVKILYSGTANSGNNSVTWNAKNVEGNIVEDGIYTYKIEASDSLDQIVLVSGNFVVVSSSPEITNISDAPDPFKPDGSLANINYTLSKNSLVTVEILDFSNKLVKTIMNETPMIKGANIAYWNGKDSNNKTVDDGIYKYRITVVDPYSKESVQGSGTITVQMYPPAGDIQNIGFTPNPFAQNGGENATISYELSGDAYTTIDIVDSNNKVVKNIINNQLKNSGTHNEIWDGKDSQNESISDGIYTLKITAKNEIGEGSSATTTFTAESLPPTISQVNDSPNPFKPNGVDLWSLSFNLSEDSNVWLELTDSTSNIVWTARPVIFTKGQKTIQLYGTNDSGQLLEDGQYTYKLWAQDFTGKKSNVVTGTLVTDKTAPIINLNEGSTGSFDKSTTISYNLSEDSTVSITISSGNTVIKTLEQDVNKNSGDNSVTWDATDSTGSIVENGNYTYTITATDGVGLTSTETGTVTKDSGAIAITNVGDSIDPFTPSGANNTTITYSLTKNAFVSLKVYDNNGDLVKTLLDNFPASKGANSVNWDGTEESNTIVVDGVYIYRINAMDTLDNSAVEVGGTVTIDRIAPVISNFNSNPYPFVPDGNNQMTIGYDLSESSKVTIEVVDGSNNVLTTLENEVQKNSGSNEVKWDAKVDGTIVEDDIYGIRIIATDNAGNSVEYYDLIGVDRNEPFIVQIDDEPDPFNPLVADFSTIHGEFSEWFSTAKATIYDNNNNKVKEIAMEDVIEFWWGWSATNTSGDEVEDGVYTYKVNGSDLFGKQAQEKEGTITLDSSVLEISELSFIPELEKPSGTINYTLSKEAKVSIGIYDGSNKLVNQVELDAMKDAGNNTSYWNGTANGKLIDYGVYTYRITAVGLNGSNALPSIGVITFEQIDEDYIDDIIDDNIGEDPDAVDEQSQNTEGISNIVISEVNASPNPYVIGGEDEYSLLKYSISEEAKVTVKVYNSSLKLVRTLSNDRYYNTSGPKVVAWNGKDDNGDFVSNGTYIYKITATDMFQRSSQVSGTIEIQGSSNKDDDTSEDKTYYVHNNQNLQILKDISITSKFEPNGTISYSLNEKATITTVIHNNQGLVVKYLEEDSVRDNKAYNIIWDGMDSLGYEALDGEYIYKITAVSQSDGTRETATGTIIVERNNPNITNVFDSPDPLSLAGEAVSIVKYNLSEKADVSIKVYDSNDKLIKTLVDAQQAAGVRQTVWNGRDLNEMIVQNGTYTYKINATDSYNNEAQQVIGTITIKDGAAAKPVITEVSVSPNPYNPIGSAGGLVPETISYTLSQDSIVTVSIYTSIDELVKVIYTDSNKNAGQNTATWYGRDSLNSLVSSGAYKVKIKALNNAGSDEQWATINLQ